MLIVFEESQLYSAALSSSVQQTPYHPGTHVKTPGPSSLADAKAHLCL